MTHLHFNGEALSLARATTIAELLAQRGLGERRVAVERNGEIVPRAQHASALIADGDRIEVVQAIGGG